MSIKEIRLLRRHREQLAGIESNALGIGMFCKSPMFNIEHSQYALGTQSSSVTVIVIYKINPKRICLLTLCPSIHVAAPTMGTIQLSDLIKSAGISSEISTSMNFDPSHSTSRSPKISS